jgi:MFS family permease
MATTETDVRAHRRRAVVASTVGTTIEWYDFFLYGTAAALVFPRLFFPGGSEFVGVIEAFSTQFVGFAARPLGAAIFGHLGDRLGRRATLISTLLLMGLSTFLIGFLPSVDAIGLAAPVLLVVLRIVQGVGVGGEWGGSVLMAMEWGSSRRRGLMASWPQVGVPLGLVLSTTVVSIMNATTGASFGTWGWRVPFLLSVVLVGISLYVRLKVLESPSFQAVKDNDEVVRAPLRLLLRTQWREMLSAAFVRTAEQGPFYIFITFVLTYGTKHLGMPRGEMLLDTAIAALIGLVTVPLFGHLSDVFGRRIVYGFGAVCTAVFAFPYFGLLDTKSSALVLLGVVVSLVFHDMQYGPQAALIAESFGTNIRYSGAGLGYQLSSVISGGPAPLIAAAILNSTGTSTGISWYIIGCSVVTVITLLVMPKPRLEPGVEESRVVAGES